MNAIAQLNDGPEQHDDVSNCEGPPARQTSSSPSTPTAPTKNIKVLFHGHYSSFHDMAV